MSSTRGKLIELLRNHPDDYISGEKLSQELQITRTAIWKHINGLKKDGYIIEGISRKGYRIIQTPDKISSNTITWDLETNWLGKSIIHKDITKTTQEIAHQAARNAAPHGTVVIANEQTKGKGRMGRTWYSSKNKGVWMSIILRPKLVPQQATLLTLLTATVLADVLSRITTNSVTIKWPNDILMHDKKLAGILTEMQAEQDQIQYVVVGIGLNVNQQQNDIPPDIRQIATSIKMETNQHWDLNKLIQNLLYTFEETYTTFIQNGFTPIKHKWERYGYQIGRVIRVKTIKQDYDAIFSGIAEDGALLVQHNGKIIKLYSAEIDWNENREEEKNDYENKH